ILYYQADAYAQYLIGAGLVRSSQMDGSYDGTPARFVASRGTIANAGFATSEPYIFKNELPKGQTGFDTRLQLINDTGYPMYGEALSIRAEDKDKLAPCLKKLVPIIQQSSVDFITNPAATNQIVLKAVTDLKDFWTYSP